MKQINKHKLIRQQAQKELGMYHGLKLTWKKFDCGLDEDGLQYACTECVICKYQDFLEWAGSVGVGTIEYKPQLDKYLQFVYVTKGAI